MPKIGTFRSLAIGAAVLAAGLLAQAAQQGSVHAACCQQPGDTQQTGIQPGPAYLMKPDLTITYANIGCTNAGTDIFIDIRVANLNNYSIAGDSVTRTFVGNVAVKDIAEPGFTGAGGRVHTYSVPNTPTRGHWVTVRVDATNQVSETNENNNAVSQWVDC